MGGQHRKPILLSLAVNTAEPWRSTPPAHYFIVLAVNTAEPHGGQHRKPIIMLLAVNTAEPFILSLAAESMAANTAENIEATANFFKKRLFCLLSLF